MQTAGEAGKVTAVVVTGAPLVLEAGVIELSPEQARLRSHNLAALSGRLYEIRKTVTFKAGEQIGWRGPVPKRLAAVLQPSGAVGGAGAAGASASAAATGAPAAANAASGPGTRRAAARDEPQAA